MTPAEMSDRIDAMRAEMMTWTSDPRDWGRDQVDSAVECWSRLEALISNLRVLARDHALVLARRLPDEHTAVTRDGATTVHRTTSTSYEWDGYELIEALAETMIDTDGQKIPAIPAQVLATVLPACQPGQTSSKWKITEVRKVLGADEAAKYRRVIFGDTTIAPGPMPQALRSARRRTQAEQPTEEVVPNTVE